MAGAVTFTRMLTPLANTAVISGALGRLQGQIEAGWRRGFIC